MGENTDGVLRKAKRSTGSTVLYAAAIVVALIGIAYLATNIVLYQKTVAQYVAQGYPAATVAGQLLPSQLLPGIYEPVAVYGGIALLLFGAGMIHQKVRNLLRLMDEPGTEGTVNEEGSNDGASDAGEGSAGEPDAGGQDFDKSDDG